MIKWSLTSQLLSQMVKKNLCIDVFFKYKNPPKSSNFQTYSLFFKELKLYWSVKLEKGKKKETKIIITN